MVLRRGLSADLAAYAQCALAAAQSHFVLVPPPVREVEDQRPAGPTSGSIKYGTGAPTPTCQRNVSLDMKGLAFLVALPSGSESSDAGVVDALQLLDRWQPPVVPGRLKVPAVAERLAPL